MLLQKEATMTISKELLDELLEGCERPEDLLGDAGLMKELKIKLMERMLGAELTAHLGYEEGKDAPPAQTNRRNGTAGKRLKGQDGEVPISVPRDRDGSFEPELVKKGQTRIDGMDDKIIGLYAAGLTVRDIRAHLEDVYGLKVSSDLISRVTDAVLDEVREWQNRALERMYPIVIFDALRVKIRDADSRMVKNKAVYVALGISRDGVREVLGLWIADNEGAKFWLSVMTELKNRGVQDILIAVVDGLKGFPDAITAAFPEATVQTCIVHLVRHSLNFCAWKDRKFVAADLRRIYGAATADQATDELDAFEEKWGGKYASIAPAWRRAWAEVIPFFAFDPAIRKIIYTTNAIESLNRVIRKSIKTRGSFPTEQAATKLIYLAIRNFEKGGRNVRQWFAARNQFAIMFEQRFNA
jgi:transposase-like protein